MAPIAISYGTHGIRLTFRQNKKSGDRESKWIFTALMAETFLLEPCTVALESLVPL